MINATIIDNWLIAPQDGTVRAFNQSGPGVAWYSFHETGMDLLMLPIPNPVLPERVQQHLFVATCAARGEMALGVR